MRSCGSRFFAIASVSVLAMLFGTGCFVMQRDYEAKTGQLDKELENARAEIAQTRADLEATHARLDSALRANADSSSDVMSSKARLNDLIGRVDEVQHDVDELKRDVGATRTELYARIDELKRAQVTAPPAPPPIAIPQDKAAHFTQLKDAYHRRDFATVRALGPEYVNRYPTDEHADEALFIMGDSDLADSRPSSSLGHMNRLLKLFPRSKLLDRTLFNMGEAYLMLHDCQNAKIAFDAVEKRFPKEKVGIDAKARLASIARNTPGLCAPP
jgi:TolA-binding protein